MTHIKTAEERLNSPDYEDTPVGNHYLLIRQFKDDEIAELRAALEQAQKKIADLEAAVKANHEWHQTYDEYGGYEDSEMFNINTKAIGGLVLEAQTPAQPIESAKYLGECPMCAAKWYEDGLYTTQSAHPEQCKITDEACSLCMSGEGVCLKQSTQPEQEPVALKVYQGEICYLSKDDDQSYGMWCPVAYDSNHGFKEGTIFYTKPATQGE